VLATLAAANLAAVTFFLLSYHQHGISFGPDRIDLDVYRIGARAWLRGASLYERLPATPAGLRLPFTYPPIAAVLLAPLALVPVTVAGTVLTLVTIALAAAVLRLFLRRLFLRRLFLRRLSLSPAAAGWLLPAALFLEPVRNTLSFGQVNVILMAMVAFDCLADTPSWPRGVLTGLAAAVKLTPAAFVLFFLLRRDYRAAATAGLSFAAATGLGFALAGRDSARYWTSTVFQASRVGQPDYAGNQSLQGVLARAGLSPHAPAGLAAWLVLSAAVLVVTGLGMRRALAAGEPCLALSLNAFAALLISPVSWSHHWVWCVPAILTLASLARRHRSRLAATAAACGLVIFAAAPQWWFPHGAGRELRWAPWEQAAGSAYVLFAVVILILAACGQPYWQESKGRGSDMPRFMDYHDDLKLPAEAIEQIAAGARDGATDEFGVRQVELYHDEDGHVYCLLDGPDEEAIRQHHEAIGVSCGDVHRVSGLA
jgi:alpha-1,2-mannosyltransferase